MLLTPKLKRFLRSTGKNFCTIVVIINYSSFVSFFFVTWFYFLKVEAFQQFTLMMFHNITCKIAFLLMHVFFLSFFCLFLNVWMFKFFGLFVMMEFDQSSN
jgi:hypothetical protein